MTLANRMAEMGREHLFVHIERGGSRDLHLSSPTEQLVQVVERPLEIQPGQRPVAAPRKTSVIKVVLTCPL